MTAVIRSLLLVLVVTSCVGGHRRKLEVVLGERETDDGAACLAMILRFHDKPATLEGLRADVNAGPDGRSNGLTLVTVAERHGLNARGLLLEDGAALASLAVPSIAHWSEAPGSFPRPFGDGRFIVLERVGQRWVEVIDPALGGRRRIEKDEFLSHATGVFIVFSE